MGYHGRIREETDSAVTWGPGEGELRAEVVTFSSLMAASAEFASAAAVPPEITLIPAWDLCQVEIVAPKYEAAAHDSTDSTCPGLHATDLVDANRISKKRLLQNQNGKHAFRKWFCNSMRS